MSHVENAEPKNGSECTNNDIVANERSAARLQIARNSADEIQITLQASRILDNAKSKSSPETGGCDEKCPEQSQSRDNKEDAYTTSGDICRICHMGRYASIADNNSSCDSQFDSDQTLLDFVYLGPLISACKCRGTVALVHTECLERWLTESGRVRCELCGYKYATKRVRRYSLLRSVVIWFHTVIATRQMLLDIGYLAMTTPVAAFSCYVCALALKMLLRNSFYQIPWMIVAMLPTCLLTLIAYWRWIITLGRLHGYRWRRYWRNNFVVRLIPDHEDDNDLRRSSDHIDAQEDFEQWRLFEEIEEFAQ